MQYINTMLRDNAFITFPDIILCGYLRNKRKKDFNGNLISSSLYLHNQYNFIIIVKYRNKWASLWWLRSPGLNSLYAAYVSFDVSFDGSVDVIGYIAYGGGGGVRSDLWLNLKS